MPNLEKKVATYKGNIILSHEDGFSWRPQVGRGGNGSFSTVDECKRDIDDERAEELQQMIDEGMIEDARDSALPPLFMDR
jgi:hypothetical protein